MSIGKAESTIRQNVRTAARVLNRIKPGWATEIDVDTLDMENGYHCVIGQVYGNYTKAGEKIYMLRAFCSNPQNYPVSVVQRYQRAWINEIERRRN